MRIRTVKPEFHQSATLATVSRELRGLAAALLNWADDEGYFVTIPAVIAGSLYPFDADGREFVADGLPKLETLGYLQLFDGNVGLITNFVQHQRINRPTKSRLKAKATKRLTLTEDSVSTHGGLSEASLLEGKGKGKGSRKGKGSGRGSGAAELAVSQPALIESPPPPPRAPTRIGALHAFFIEERGYRLTDEPPDGCGLEEAPPDEPPNWALSGATLGKWIALWPDESPEAQDRLIKAMMRCWLEEPYWAAPVDKKTGKPSTPYPWGAFLTEGQWRKAYEKLTSDEPKAGAA